jgi:cytochrome P450
VNVTPITGLTAAREYLKLLHDPVAAMRSLYQRHGSLVALGPVAIGEPAKLNILAVGPELNRQVLGDPARFRPTGLVLRGPENSAQRRVRFGLTRMVGEQHRQQRQLVMPAFHRTAIRGYHELMVGNTATLLKQWQHGQRYDIYAEMRMLSLRIASAVLFSHDPAEALPIGHLIDDWLGRNFASTVLAFPVDLPGTPYHGLLRLAERIEERILAMIARRRSDPGRHSDVLSLLMEARDDENYRMSDIELVGQTTILFMAAFETVAAALTWTLFLVAQHPEVMHKLMNEFGAVLNGGVPDVAQLGRLDYLDVVIKESMRILPPVPYTIHVTTRKVPLGPYALTHGARVISSHYLTHHLSHLYAEPERFRPERWKQIDPNQYEYLPFSAGPRTCIGAAFAVQFLKISLSMMLQRFRFAVVPGTRIDRIVRITMQPRRGLPMSIFDNDGKFVASEVRGQIREMVTLP